MNKRLKFLSFALAALALCPSPTMAQQNPILPGFHADPEIVYSNLTNRYYIYSTTDGTPPDKGYKMTDWLTFSTTDLKHWRQHPVALDINTRKAGAAVSPTMYGIFFEDINYAADGGLYGELVKNRSFEFPQALLGWQAFGNVEVKADGPFERCPHYVVLGFTGHKECATGLQNEGYFGIGFVKDEPYRFTVWARALDGDATIDVSLADQSTQDETQERAKAQIKVSGSEWKKYEAVLTPGKTAQKGCLRVLLSGTRSVALEHVSLFPVNTFKNRENGMRRDLAQALYDMHPGVLRFPGGCIVEGESLKHRY